MKVVRTKQALCGNTLCPNFGKGCLHGDVHTYHKACEVPCCDHDGATCKEVTGEVVSAVGTRHRVRVRNKPGGRK